MLNSLIYALPAAGGGASIGIIATVGIIAVCLLNVGGKSINEASERLQKNSPQWLAWGILLIFVAFVLFSHDENGVSIVEIMQAMRG